MRCDGCGAENKAGRRYCGRCGKPLASACAHCGFANEPDEKFCGGCGKRLDAGMPPAAPEPGGMPASASAIPFDTATRQPAEVAVEAERRPITVLFADLAGYTHLSQALDPETVHRLLERYFSAVDGILARWGGTIDKHIGDAVMALFGAPIAHGDDAVRAVRAAAEIQAAVPALASETGRPLGVHIGIAAGEVMASGLGSAQHRAYTVIGPSVNLAARLLGIAHEGETVADQVVYEQAKRHARFEAIDNIRSKGIDDAFRAWRLVDLQPESSMAEHALVGREAELTQLVAALDGCVARGIGGTAFIRGEPGIGKSRLVRELRQLAAARGFACHAGLVLDFGMVKGRDAIREIVASVIGLPPRADDSMKLAAIERDARCGAEHRPFVLDLLDLPQSNGTRDIYEAMDNAARQRGRAAALRCLLESAATQAPMLLTVEDLHWADAPTLAYVAEAVRAAGALPIVIVLTSRLEDDPLGPSWRASVQGSPFVTLDLGPLSAKDAFALASSLSSTTPGVARKCVERAAGNPLFLEQLLHAAGENDDRLPASLHSLVLSRVDRLPERDRAALRAAAVIGQRFPLDLLRHLAQVPDYECDALVTAFLVRPDGDDFLFAHALIRDGVYASLTLARRAELHRAAAAWYGERDPVLHAEHLDRAGAPEAAGAYLRAARGQMEVLRLERALALADRAATIARNPPDVIALQLLRSELLREMGDGGPAADAAHAALAVAEAPLDRCRALLSAAAGMRLTANVDAALATLDKVESIAFASGFTRELAELHYLRGNLRFAQGRIGECRDEHAQALACAQALADPAWEARALSGLADADYADGRMRSACDRFARCVALCDAHGLTRIAIANRGMMGHCRLYLNDFAGVLSDLEATLAMARRVGNRHAEMFALEGLGLALAWCGRYEEAVPPLTQSLALAENVGARRYQALIWACLAESAIGLGDSAKARDAIEHALALARETGMGFCGPIVLQLKARLARSRDDAARWRAEAEALLSAGCVSHCHIAYHRDGIDDGIARHEWARVLRHVEELERFTAPEPLPYTDWLIARGRVLAALAERPDDAALQAERSRLQAEFARVDWRVHWP
jgi:class 3 adenylate cyclase/tetratricopeptide (TPR) repeat protein